MLHNVAPTKPSSKGSGFTLIEILMVMAVLGLLVAIAIPQFMSYRSQAVDAEMKSDLRNTAIAIEAYFAKQTVLPASAAKSGGTQPTFIYDSVTGSIH